MNIWKVLVSKQCPNIGYDRRVASFAPVNVARMVAIAQLVEHRLVVPVVAGSSPVSHPMYMPRLGIPEAGHVTS